jgi:hypothetical protein
MAASPAGCAPSSEPPQFWQVVMMKDLRFAAPQCGQVTIATASLRMYR